MIRLVLFSPDSHLQSLLASALKPEYEVRPGAPAAGSNEIRRQFLSAFRARPELSWAPLFNLEQGLERTITWYREFLA